MDNLVEAGRKENENKKTGKVKEILVAPSWQEDNILDSCIDRIIDGLYSLCFLNSSLTVCAIFPKSSFSTDTPIISRRLIWTKKVDKTMNKDPNANKEVEEELVIMDAEAEQTESAEPAATFPNF